MSIVNVGLDWVAQDREILYRATRMRIFEIIEPYL
jgi:hypothetical protein